MIRKPSDKEFQETALVNAVRESRKIAVEGGKGVSQGIGKIYLWYLTATFGFGFVMSLFGNLGLNGGFGVIIVGAAIFVAYRYSRRGDAPVAALQILAPPTGKAAGNTVSGAGRYMLDISTVTRKTIGPAILGAFLLYLARGGLSRVMFPVVGLVFVTTALLHLARLFGDRTVLKFDGQGVAVKGLLGERRLSWTDVADIGIRKSRWPGSWLSLSSNRLCITASPDRAAGPAELNIPIDIMALDAEQLVGLVSSLFHCRANAHAPSRQDRPPLPWDAPRPAFAAPSPDQSLDTLRHVRSFGRRVQTR